MHVTAILPVWNGEATVVAAIESIVAQTYVDWDMIVVDDASTDGTAAVLDAWAARDARISVIRNHRNVGLARSLNLAWPRARGELIARMDADDVSLPGRFQAQVAFLCAHPEVHVVGTGIYLLDDRGRMRGAVLLPERHEELVATIFRRVPVIHSTVMMRRGFLEQTGGYDPRLRRAQDADLWLRGYSRFRYANVASPLVEYRWRSRPSVAAIYYGTLVTARGVLRDGLVFTHAWWPLRVLLGLTAAKLGIWRWRQEP
jgi:glycosyltransferase involved in cell wall biosynthesis